MKTLVLASLLLSSFTAEPLAISWKRLADVKFNRKFNKELAMYFLYPTFGPTVRQLEGKEVRIRGYLIPVDEEGNIYVISEQPMASCFFCGGAGPESIIELQFKNKKQKFKTDALRFVKGKLLLNPTDVEHLNYILTEAEIVN